MTSPSFQELDRRAIASGLRRPFIAQRLGINLSTYYRRLRGEHEATVSEFRSFERLVEASETVAGVTAEGSAK